MRTKLAIIIISVIAALITTIALYAKPAENCQVFDQTMYVEAGSLSKCVRQNGLQEYTNVRRLDGTYSEYPDELRILLFKYMEFHYSFNFEPETLTDKDHELFRQLQEELLAYDKNDISFLYGYLNQ